MCYQRKLFLVFVTVAITASSLGAQSSWYVDPQGADVVGSGSIVSPFRTISYAANQCQPGDTVFIRGGTYRRVDFADGDIWTAGSVGRIAVNGAPGAYITFQSYPGEHPVIEFDASFGILIQNASYIRIAGLEVVGVAPQITQLEADAAWGLYRDGLGAIHDLAQEMGINITDPSLRGTTVSKAIQTGSTRPPYYNGRGIAALNSHHVEIVDNTIRDVTGIAIRAGGSDYVTISRNTIFRNGLWNTFGVGAIDVFGSVVRPAGDSFAGIKMTIEKNLVHSNENRMVSWNPSKPFVHFTIDEGTGIFVTNNVQTYMHGYFLIANNVCALNGTAGIEFHLSERGIIEHNSLYYNGTRGDGPHGGIGVNHVDDVTIVNNISYATSDHFALSVMGQPVTNVTVAANILFNENSTTRAVHRLLPSGWTEADPLYANPTSVDLTLQVTSPATNSGSSNVVSSDDITCAVRADGQPDVGAYEFRSSTHLVNKIALQYNFNGIAHTGEIDNPDDPLGYRSISDRGLSFVGGVPSEPALAAYSLVSAPLALDIVHLGNRNTVSGGIYAFQATANGDSIGTQPQWLSSVDQVSPQTTQLGNPIRMDGSSSASLIFMISDGGGSFDVAFGFASGSPVVATVSGGDWLGGSLSGVQDVDSAAVTGANLNVTERTIDLSAEAGRVMTSITFLNSTNPNSGIAIVAMNVVGCVDCANGSLAQISNLGGGTGASISTTSNGGLGCDVVWKVSGGAPSSLGAWLIGAGVMATPVAVITPGCPGVLHVSSPLVFSGALDTNGEAVFTLSFPAVINQAICGFQVTGQHVTIRLPPCMFGVSDALAITIGN